jgi:hypothetical protein
MISIIKIFENFINPWSSQNHIKIKNVLPKLPTKIFAGRVSKIKKMNNKLSSLNNKFRGA